MNYKKLSSLFLLTLFLCNGSFALPGLSLEDPSDSILDNYLKIHQNFVGELCTEGVEDKYNQLLKDFRGEGFYIPIFENAIDLNALRFRIPLVQQKEIWINEILNNLVKSKTFPSYKELVDPIEKQIEILLDLKNQHYHSSSVTKRSQLASESLKQMGVLKVNFKNMLDKIPFLLSFKFPLDFYELRREYDEVKNTKDKLLQKKANHILLKRKIVEDGAYDPDKSKPDVFLRASLDTIYLELEKNHEFITENLRYDLKSTLKLLDRFISMGKAAQIERIAGWKERIQKEAKFYYNILKEAEGSKVEQEHLQQFVNKRNEARFKLMDFVLNKQTEVYDFWAKQSETNQALFVMETILYNEVGEVDGREATERKDVARVVFNRRNLPFYSQLTAEDDIFPYLKSYTEKARESNWQNVLFKEGEFSFTYFYMPATVKIFCPDVTRKGEFLRRENLKISLNVLENPESDFKAVRYFSRASMIGRIDMSTIWTDHTPLAERPGPRIGKIKLLKKLLNKSKYTYLYSFIDDKKNEYDVIELAKKIFVLKKEGLELAIFKYRNPHHFKYFEFSRPISMR